MQESYFQVGMHTCSFKWLFGSIGLGHFCIDLPFVLISLLWHLPLLSYNGKLNLPQTVFSFGRDGWPADHWNGNGCTHAPAAGRPGAAGSWSSQCAGETICFILFVFVFLLFPPFHYARSVILTCGLCHHSMQSIVVQCNAIQVKGRQPEPRDCG